MQDRIFTPLVTQPENSLHWILN